MAEGVNVRFTGALKKFVERRAGSEGLYGSASEYIRDLVRRDFERDEERRWDALYDELKAGMNAPASEFAPLNADDVLADARRRHEAER